MKNINYLLLRTDNKTNTRRIGFSFALNAATLLCLSQLLTPIQTSCAQGTMSTNALERSRFYTAPREYQIVDDRPVVRDFREGPTAPGQMALPNGPGGGAGAGGAGGIGGGTGSSTTLPAGGLPLSGGTGPGYRNDPTGMSTLPKSGFAGSNIPAGGMGSRGVLPKSGFSGTNIPASGMGPRGILPGVNTGVVGKIMNQNLAKQTGAVPMRATSLKGPSGGNVSGGPPSVSNYGGYSSNPTSYGNSSRTEQNVRGHLLRSN